MRLDDFKNIDEVVQLGIIEFKKRSTALSINWIPSRQNVYSSQCYKFSHLLQEVCTKATAMDLVNSKMNPSQFIKAAQDYQLAAKMAHVKKEMIIPNFMKLANIGMMIKRYNYDIYKRKIKTIGFIINDSEIIKKANQLNGLLRAFSEAIYLDDHTISGEIYGDLSLKDKSIIVRSYQRLCPEDLLDGFADFQIQQVDTYCLYESKKIDCDCLGNIQYINNVRPILSGFYGECHMKNGERVLLNNKSTVDIIINRIENQLNKTILNYKNKTLKEQQHILLEATYYAFKPILDIINYEWRPSNDEIEQYIQSLDEKSDFTRISEETMQKNNNYLQRIRKIVDPRVSF